MFAATGAAVLIEWNAVFFLLTPAQACRAVYGLNPFPEAVVISHYIESHCPPHAQIAVLGSESQRFSSTPTAIRPPATS